MPQLIGSLGKKTVCRAFKTDGELVDTWCSGRLDDTTDFQFHIDWAGRRWRNGQNLLANKALRINPRQLASVQGGFQHGKAPIFSSNNTPQPPAHCLVVEPKKYSEGGAHAGARASPSS